MRTRRWLTLGLALMMSLTAVSAAAQRPNPHSWTAAQPDATAAPSECEMVKPYTRELYTALDDSDAFIDFFITPDIDVGDISTEEAKNIVTDGNALITRLNDLDAPGPYADAHRHIIVFLQVQIDTAHFLGIDTSQVPDLAASDAAVDAIEAGEVALAKACPDEVDAVGGYILIDPAGEDAPLDPEHMPEGTSGQDTGI